MNIKLNRPIDEVLSDDSLTPLEKMKILSAKTVTVPKWGNGLVANDLLAQYNPEFHPVMNPVLYPDITDDDGHITKVTRITYDLQRLATKRMTEIVCGIPPKRVYRPQNDRQRTIAGYIEKIYDRNRIDAVNVERLNMYFASCETLTLWYTVEQPNTMYGFKSAVKLRCRNFAPMNGDVLWPLFDEYGDMIALSVAYQRVVDGVTVSYFDAYTATRHIKWTDEGAEWHDIDDESITIGKIPGVYMSRPAPVWENTSNIVYEMEWAMSRNGNYLRENSKPLLALYADQEIGMGNERPIDREFRAIIQLPQGSQAAYVTWAQAIDNLQYYVKQLRSMFFALLQLPDWSYDQMSQQALSGESRKQIFIDAHLKVKDESGALLEFFAREINVVKAFLKSMLPDDWSADIEALPVDVVITPYTITDESDRIDNLMKANGNMPIMSQRESIEKYGESDDVDKTLEEIAEQQKTDLLQSEPTE